MTGRSNLKRQREEQAHEQILEREKLLYDRRIELYAEVIPVIDRVIDGLRTYDYSDSGPEPQMPTFVQNEEGDVEANLDTVRRLFHQVHVISGLAVRALVSQFIYETERTLDRINRGERADSAFAGTEVDFAANHLIWEMRIEVGVASRDDHDEFEMRELY